MHSFLRSIGFADSLKSEYETDLLLDDLYHTYEHQTAVREEDGNRAYLELSKSFGPHIGIKVCGELSGNGFRRLTYFPYLEGTVPTTDSDVTIDRRSDGCTYAGMAEEGRIGVSLIYFVQNPADYRRESIQGSLGNCGVSTTLTGLASSGMILLPGKSSIREEVVKERDEFYRHHDQMVLAAKNGSQEAIESLTMEDMDTYAMISRRMMKEDILTIVDTFFMPSGMECDQYQVLGTILFYTKVQNSYTKENLYQLTIDCNGLVFDICINCRDLLGDPEEGRRFKGSIWLQGKLNIDDPGQGKIQNVR